MCVRQMRPPVGGDYWILKIAHAPSDKNLSKNGCVPQRGSLSAEGAFAKKIFGAGRGFCWRRPRIGSSGNTLLKAGHLMRSSVVSVTLRGLALETGTCGPDSEQLHHFVCLAGAQQSGRVPKIGWLKIQDRQHTPGQLRAFRDGMRALALVEGRDYEIEERWR
jgi:hypothetical protein